MYYVSSHFNHCWLFSRKNGRSKKDSQISICLVNDPDFENEHRFSYNVKAISHICCIVRLNHMDIDKMIRKEVRWHVYNDAM